MGPLVTLDWRSPALFILLISLSSRKDDSQEDAVWSTAGGKDRVLEAGPLKPDLTRNRHSDMWTMHHHPIVCGRRKAKWTQGRKEKSE